MGLTYMKCAKVECEKARKIGEPFCKEHLEEVNMRDFPDKQQPGDASGIQHAAEKPAERPQLSAEQVHDACQAYLDKLDTMSASVMFAAKTAFHAGAALLTGEAEKVPRCWHKEIDDEGICKACGAKAAIKLEGLSEPSLQGRRVVDMSQDGNRKSETSQEAEVAPAAPPVLQAPPPSLTHPFFSTALSQAHDERIRREASRAAFEKAAEVVNGMDFKISEHTSPYDALVGHAVKCRDAILALAESPVSGAVRDGGGEAK